MSTAYDTDVKYKPEFLRDMDKRQISDLLESAQSTQLALRTNAQFRPPDKPHLFQKTRRDIARFKTLLGEKP